MSTPEAIRLGIAVSLSGRYAAFGRQALEGLRCFVRDCNRAGGVRDPRANRRVPLVVLAEDDCSGGRSARRSVEKLIGRDAIDLLIGPYGSGPTLAAAEVAERCRYVLWNHGGSSDEIFRRGYRWTVGISSPASQYLIALLEFFRFLDPSLRKVALFAAKTGFASQVAAGALDWIHEARLELTASRSYESGSGDFAPLLVGLEEDPPDILVGAGRFEDDLLLARQLAKSKPADQGGGAGWSGGGRVRESAGASFGRLLRAEPMGAASAVRGRLRTGGRGLPRVLHRVRPRDRSTTLPRRATPPASSPFAASRKQAPSTKRLSARLPVGSAVRPSTGRSRSIRASGRQTAHSLVVAQWQNGEKKVVWPPAAAETPANYPASPGHH